MEKLIKITLSILFFLCLLKMLYGYYELLLFDKRMAAKQKTRHIHDNILNIEGSKSWRLASINYRMKVRELYRNLDVVYPKM
jgi:hypothetical protein